MTFNEPYKQHNYIGAFADDAAATAYVVAVGWDAFGDVPTDMVYFDLTLTVLKVCVNNVWKPISPWEVNISRIDAATAINRQVLSGQRTEIAGPVIEPAIVLAESGGNVAVDLTLGNVFTLALDGAWTLSNPTGLVGYGTIALLVTQNAGGTGTLAFGANWHFAGGVAPVITAAANAVDLITGFRTPTAVLCSILQDVKSAP